MATSTLRTAPDTIVHRTIGPFEAVLLWLSPALLTAGTILMLTPDAWTVAHAIFLAGAAISPVVAGTLAHLPWPRGLPERVARAGGVLMVLGGVALSAQFAVDFAVMALADGEDEAASELFQAIQGSWMLSASLYVVGPALLFVGLGLIGWAMVRSVTPIAGWVLIAAALLMGIARGVDQRALEVVALVAITAALAWTTRLLRTSSRP